MAEPKRINIVLVEDDEVDAEAFERALRKSSFPSRLFRARDGRAALELLTDRDKVIPEPRVVLLDLKLPRVSGIELLEQLRASEDLRRTIVFVLTTSDEESDKRAAYEHNVAAYFVKGEIAHDYRDVVSLLERYSRFVEFPPDGGLESDLR